MELKMMLAHILLNFDIFYADGVHKRPENKVFDGAIIPDARAKLIFRTRLRHTRGADQGLSAER